MQLIYLAPLAWESFAQRPHMFVRWFHEKHQAKVLWINPYPTRFLQWQDLRRLAAAPDACATVTPDWLTVVSPNSLPLEPLAAGQWLNRQLWRHLLERARAFAQAAETVLAIGKPSALATALLGKLPHCCSLLDLMDDYPQFYRGWSQVALRKCELNLVNRVSVLLVSSTGLKDKWSTLRPDLQLVRNGVAPELFLPLKQPRHRNTRPVFGYVGTLAHWFDWPWVAHLARTFPHATVRLIGPLFGRLPADLPDNVEVLPACDHASAIAAMQEFDVGLIPFRLTQLTAAVDPIKFYEYRALGLAVVSTPFGEMTRHASERGVFLSRLTGDIAGQMKYALDFTDEPHAQAQFIAENTWTVRFERFALTAIQRKT